MLFSTRFCVRYTKEYTAWFSLWPVFSILVLYIILCLSAIPGDPFSIPALPHASKAHFPTKLATGMLGSWFAKKSELWVELGWVHMTLVLTLKTDSNTFSTDSMESKLGIHMCASASVSNVVSTKTDIYMTLNTHSYLLYGWMKKVLSEDTWVNRQN